MNYLVTGAGSGIGFYTVMALLKEGETRLFVFPEMRKTFKNLKIWPWKKGNLKI